MNISSTNRRAFAHRLRWLRNILNRIKTFFWPSSENIFRCRCARVHKRWSSHSKLCFSIKRVWRKIFLWLFSATSTRILSPRFSDTNSRGHRWGQSVECQDEFVCMREKNSSKYQRFSHPAPRPSVDDLMPRIFLVSRKWPVFELHRRRTILRALSSAPPNRVQILIFRPSFKVRDCCESEVSTASRKFYRLHNHLQLSQNCKSLEFSTGSPRVKVFVVTVRAGTPRGWVRILRTLIKLNSWCRARDEVWNFQIFVDHKAAPQPCPQPDISISLPNHISLLKCQLFLDNMQRHREISKRILIFFSIIHRLHRQMPADSPNEFSHKMCCARKNVAKTLFSAPPRRVSEFFLLFCFMTSTPKKKV